jgi:Ca-activated chloride channel family protein
VSFSDPLWLAALALIPLALVAQRLVRRFARRRARRYAVRYAAAGTLARALAETTGGARRERIPAFALLAAVALLAFALAGPRLRERVPATHGSIVLVLDHSGSMAADDVRPSRLAAAIRAANTFIAELPAGVRVGVVTFSTVPQTVRAPTLDHAAVRAVIDRQRAGGGTDTGPALLLALRLLAGGARSPGSAAIVLLSDGAANLGVSPLVAAMQARREHIPIYTVALGTPGGVLNDGIYGIIPVPPDPRLMAAIAHQSGGRAYDARTEGRLSFIYRSLGARLASTTRELELGPFLLLAAAGLLCAALAASALTLAALP